MAPQPIVETLHWNSRSGQHAEDIAHVEYTQNGKILAIAGDGVSGFHSPNVPNRMFKAPSGAEISGAQLVGSRVLEAFRCPGDLTLADVLRQANNTVASDAHQHGISIERPDDLPAMDFAAAEVDRKVTTVNHAGDCGAVWRLRSGHINGTPNQCLEFDRRVQPKFQAIKNSKGMGAAWNEIEPDFRQARLDLTNFNMARGGYATLNGQPNLPKCWTRVEFTIGDDPSSIKVLILFTDGLIEGADRTNREQVARHVLDLYDRGGLSGILAAHGYDVGEATGVAIKF